MAIPVGAFANAFKLGIDTTMESDTPVRVAVYVDESASPFIVTTVRDALVPATTSALVRVSRLTEQPAVPKPDTDVVLVLSCGSDILEPAVRDLVVSGAPVCVVAESSVEAPFISVDTPVLGLVAATDAGHLTEALARWILDRTEKGTAFAANFAFMRDAAANRIITQAALANMASGALIFIPGADFPVMAFTQAGMVLQLSSAYGLGLKPERAYEIGAVLLAGLGLRGVSRLLCSRVPRASFAIQALVAGFGTYGMGKALAGAYERGIDYDPVNRAVSGALAKVRAAVGAAGEARATDADAAAREV